MVCIPCGSCQLQLFAVYAQDEAAGKAEGWILPFESESEELRMFRMFRALHKPSFGRWFLGTIGLLCMTAFVTLCIFGMDSGAMWLVHFVSQGV